LTVRYVQFLSLFNFVNMDLELSLKFAIKIRHGSRVLPVLAYAAVKH